MENENNWVKILINKLGLPSTADFCRKTDLGRGLVDKLSAGDNQPRFATLQKIKNAFPQTNMNWLISGLGRVLVDVKDDNEVKLLEQYRLKIKTEGNQRLVERFSVSVDYFVQDHREMEELENNAKAQDVKDKYLMRFRMVLLLFQYRRQLASDLLLQVPKSGTLLTGHIPGLKEQYSDLLDYLNNEILKTVKLITDYLVSNPEEPEQNVASETSLDEDLSDGKGQEWSELLEEEVGELNFDDKL